MKVSGPRLTPSRRPRILTFAPSVHRRNLGDLGMFRRLNRLAFGVLSLAVLGGPSMAAASQTVDAAAGKERFIVVARSDADYDRLRAAVQRAGGSVVKDMRDGGMLVATGATSLKAQVQATGLSRAVAKDHIETLIQPEAKRDTLNAAAVRSRTVVDPAKSQAIAKAQPIARAQAGAAAAATVKADPAFSFPGLMWSSERIEAPAAWQTTTGAAQIKVGVARYGPRLHACGTGVQGRQRRRFHRHRKPADLQHVLCEPV